MVRIDLWLEELQGQVALILFLLTIPVVAAGCALSLGPAAATPDPQLAVRVARALERVQDLHLTADVAVTGSLLDDEIVAEAWYAPQQDWLRLEILESAQPGLKGIITASKGSEGWSYKPAEQRIDVGAVDTIKPAIAYDVISSTLRVLFSADLAQSQVLARDYVDGQWAFRLAVPQGAGSCSLWVQASTLLPTRLQCGDAQRGQYSLKVGDAEYNLGLTEDLFEPNFLPSENYSFRRVD